MSFTYTYSIYSFSNGVFPSQFSQEIINSSISATLSQVNIIYGNSTIQITFTSSLTTEEETIMNTLISNHNPNENLVLEEKNANNINYKKISTQTPTSTTSQDYTQVESMVLTPPEGTYLVSFSGTCSGSKNNSDLTFCLYFDENIVTDTVRTVYSKGNFINTLFSIHTQQVITFNGSQSVQVMCKTNSGTITVYERNLICARI